MKLSSHEEYGVRCLIAIARAGDEGFLTIPLIAKAEGLTESHVAKLLAILRRADFVKSTRGQSGGYALSRPADKVYIKDVLDTLGGRLYDESYCGRHAGVLEECVHSCQCRLDSLWRDIQAAVDSAIDGITLEDLVTCVPVSKVELYSDGRPKAEAQ